MGGGVGSDKIPIDKTSYTPKLIWDKLINEYMNTDDHSVNRRIIVRKYVLEYGYKEKTANKWIDTFIELNNLREKSGYIILD